MDRKHILSSFVMAAAFSVHVFSAQAQTTWLWPIKGQEAGQGVICAPQQYVGEEFNFGNLIVAAPEGTDVLRPADGVVLNFGVGYEKSLHESVSFHSGSDNFDSILGELEEAGELKDLPVPTRYVGGDIFMRLEDGRMIFISGLTGGIPMKTGMRVSKGEVIGRVGYAYHKIDRPHIILSVTGRTGRPDDPMAPFGIPTTFLEPEEMTTPEFLTEEQAVEDISVLMDAYRELFPSMDEIVTPAQFETFRTGALNAVRGGVSYPDFYDIVYSSSTSRLMHDSHIRLRTPNPKIDITAQKYVPNIIHGILGDTVFVRHASESYKQHVGKKIVSIDGIPSAEICRRSMDMVSGYDGCNRSVVDRLLLVKYWYLYGSVDRPRTTTVVLEDGYPMSYSIFNGSQYEGRTMIPIIDDFVQRFRLTDFIIVADSGLMSTKNVELLESAGYRYILGARIRNESADIKDRILAVDKTDGNIVECLRNDGRRLIVGYSEARAKKNSRNRDKGVERLRKAYAKGTLTSGYNKFLDISRDITVNINEERIAEDGLWDGLKGYITNTDLPGDEVISQYHGLWVVERAFRIGKGTLEMRPMFHFTEKRIEAHICICFVAYKVYKELERVIRGLDMKMSVDKVLEIAKTITTLRIRLPNGMVHTETLYTTHQQEAIKPLLEALEHDILG